MTQLNFIEKLKIAVMRKITSVHVLMKRNAIKLVYADRLQD